MRSLAVMALAGLCLLPCGAACGAHPSAAAGIPESMQSQGAPSAPCREVFEKVQEGLSAGNVGLFSRYFGSQVLVNLRGAESGYYSASQAYYLLESYLKPRKLARFAFSTISDSSTNPYATGNAALNYRGNREYAQVYVSLSLVGDRWMITQINIY